MKAKQEATFSPIIITLETEKEAINLMHFLGCFSLTNLREIKNINFAHTQSFDVDECSRITGHIFDELFDLLWNDELLDESYKEEDAITFCCVKLDEHE